MLKMKTTRSPETSVDIQRITRRHIAQLLEPQTLHIFSYLSSSFIRDLFNNNLHSSDYVSSNVRVV
jgi:hypothetical protein